MRHPSLGRVFCFAVALFSCGTTGIASHIPPDKAVPYATALAPLSALLIWNRAIVQNPSDLQTGRTRDKIAQNQHIQAIFGKKGGSVEVTVEATWGGQEKPQITIGLSGEVHDNQGNYIKGDVSKEIGGESNVSVAAGIPPKEGEKSDQ